MRKKRFCEPQGNSVPPAWGQDFGLAARLLPGADGAEYPGGRGDPEFVGWGRQFCLPEKAGSRRNRPIPMVPGTLRSARVSSTGESACPSFFPYQEPAAAEASS